MARYLIYIGVFCILLGVLWPFVVKLPFGRLPGDIIYRRDNFTIYFPLGTSLLISVILSLIYWFFRR
jgi:hypothetical protein